MKDWFQQLAPRERLLIGAATILTLVAMIMLLGIRPMLAARALAEKNVADKQQLLTDLEGVASRFGPVSGTPTSAPGAGQSLVVLVDRTTRSHGLGAFLKRNQPDGDTRIRLRFENAPFDSMIGWLEELQAKYALTAESASIDTGREAGRVNCNLVLARR